MRHRPTGRRSRTRWARCAANARRHAHVRGAATGTDCPSTVAVPRIRTRSPPAALRLTPWVPLRRTTSAYVTRPVARTEPAVAWPLLGTVTSCATTVRFCADPLEVVTASPDMVTEWKLRAASWVRNGKPPIETWGFCTPSAARRVSARLLATCSATGRRRRRPAAGRPGRRGRRAQPSGLPVPRDRHSTAPRRREERHAGNTTTAGGESGELCSRQ